MKQQAGKRIRKKLRALSKSARSFFAGAVNAPHLRRSDNSLH